MGVIKTIGDWAAKTREWAAAAASQLQTQAVGPLEEIGEEVAKTVIEDIVLRRIGPPNAPSTVARKGDDTALVDSGRYAKSITAAPVERKLFGSTVTLVVEIGPKDLPNPELPAMLEYGTSRMPARPHWRPAMHAVANGARFRAFLKGKFFKLSFRRGSR